MAYKKIIFVSEENSFTSPIAAGLFLDMLKRDNRTDMEVDSCGMVVLFPEPANPKGVAIAKSRGIDLENHRAKPVSEDMFGGDVLVLTMREKTKSSLYKQCKNAVNVYTAKEFIGFDGNIEVPYGKGMKEYGEVYTELEKIVAQIYEKVTV